MSTEIVAELRRAAACRDPWYAVSTDAFCAAKEWLMRDEVMLGVPPRTLGAWFLMVAEAIESGGV